MLFRGIDSLLAGLFGTFQRMIFWELLRVFSLVLIGLAGVFTLLAMLQQLQFGQSLGQAIRMLPLLIPTSIPWITPPSCLFASCVVYGRLANDNEAVALKAAGVDLLSVLRPAILLGLLAACGTTVLQFQITPMAWRQSREVLLDDTEEAICLYLKKERMLKFTSGDTQCTLHVQDVQDQRLQHVVFKRKKKDRNGKETTDLVARTREARLQVDLERGKVLLDAKSWDTWVPDSAAGTSSSDKAYEVDLPQAYNLAALRNGNRDNPAMIDWSDLLASAKERADLAHGNRLKLKELEAIPPEKILNPTEGFELAQRMGVPPDRAPIDPAERARQVEYYSNSSNLLQRLDRSMRYEYFLRPAIAFGCLVFVVLGCPVGLWANRSDYLSIFVICFLPALFVYYPILFMVGSYARDGKIPMWLGVWAANMVVALAAILLSWRLIKR